MPINKPKWSVQLQPHHVDKAVEETKQLLRDNGLPDKFTVKIHPHPGKKNWLALYKTGSTARSRPIFWVNPQFGHHVDNAFGEYHSGKTDFEKDLHGNLVDTLLHEYAHSMADSVRHHFGQRYLNHSDTGKLFQKEVAPDEEEFAEGMINHIKNAKVPTLPWIHHFHNSLKRN